MIYHILNGGCMAQTFPADRLGGAVIVDGEARVDRDFQESFLRAEIEATPSGSEYNLWFEYDLFCQVNMWYVLSILPRDARVFVVYSTFFLPGDQHFWTGFGPATAEQMISAYPHRMMLTEEDILLGRQLWEAFEKDDAQELGSASSSPHFPYLSDVIDAYLDKGRPERVVREVMATHGIDFHTVLSEFWKRERIYGFGDVQLKKIYDKVLVEDLS